MCICFVPLQNIFDIWPGSQTAKTYFQVCLRFGVVVCLHPAIRKRSILRPTNRIWSIEGFHRQYCSAIHPPLRQHPTFRLCRLVHLLIGSPILLLDVSHGYDVVLCIVHLLIAFIFIPNLAEQKLKSLLAFQKSQT